MRIATLLLAAAFGWSPLAVGGTGGPAAVDLEVTAIVAPDPAASDGLLTYSIVVTNGGPGIALDAQMLELLSEDVAFESLDEPGFVGGWDCTVPPVGAHGKISCTNKGFLPGSSVTFTVTARAGPCLAGVVLTSTTVVSSATDETDPENNTATASSTVVDSGACDDGNPCTIGDRCTSEAGFFEDFDRVAPPGLPPGWVATIIGGPDGALTWRTNSASFDTPPNAVFAPSATKPTDLRLDSPELRIQSPTAQLTFKNRFDLEQDFDGGVLEISMGGGEFEDILAAGGTFDAGDYNGTISDRYGSPIAGRRAWTGISDGFVLTKVSLPSTAAGQPIVFRWRMATDLNVGWVGQWIDSVSVTNLNVCQGGQIVACDDNDACTVDSCDPIAGCVHAPASCDDGDACTDDSCDRNLGCTHTDNTAACDDKNACTKTDRCVSGVCVGADPVVCEDSDPCSAGSCDPRVGCVSTTANLDAGGFSVGRVDGRDLALLARAWNSCPSDSRYNVAANLDPQDPCIDVDDFHVFMGVFGHDCSH